MGSSNHDDPAEPGPSLCPRSRSSPIEHDEPCHALVLPDGSALAFPLRSSAPARVGLTLALAALRSVIAPHLHPEESRRLDELLDALDDEMDRISPQRAVSVAELTAHLRREVFAATSS